MRIAAIFGAGPHAPRGLAPILSIRSHPMIQRILSVACAAFPLIVMIGVTSIS